MAKNTIAQLEHLFQDFNLQMIEKQKLDVESIVASGDLYATWQRLAVLFHSNKIASEE